MISETKLDGSLPTRQLLIHHRIKQIGMAGTVWYVREDIPSKLIPVHFSYEEGFFLKINLTKKKLVIFCSYDPHK